MRIAVIGAGVSGLVAAHRLAQHTHEVVVYEANDYAGGHTHTIAVEARDGGTLHVDTGFIVFNDRNYPNFERLLAELGVATQPTSMSFSVSDAAGAFEYASTSPNGLFATRRNLASPRFWRMLRDIPRFQRAAAELAAGDRDDVSLGDWIEQQRFSGDFAERVLVPMASAVWSADPEQRWSFPARFLAQFFANHGMLALRDRPRWRVVQGGSARYVDALLTVLGARVRLAAPVSRIVRKGDHVLVESPAASPERFDEVVIATHSDQALAMLADADRAERDILGAMRYQPNEVVLHTDTRLLPRHRRAWASWNYHLGGAVPGRAAVTYHMNRLQSLAADREYCVTLNRTADIDPARTIGAYTYAHPVFTLDSVRARERHGEISGRRRTHFCGAYWGWGFHEDGVVSALRVAEQVGLAEPSSRVAA